MWIIKNTYRIFNEKTNAYTRWIDCYLDKRAVNGDLLYNVFAGISTAAQFSSKAKAVNCMKQRGLTGRRYADCKYAAVKLTISPN